MQTADFLAALACDAVRELERRSLLLAHIRDLRALASEVALERLNLLELAVMLLAQLVELLLRDFHLVMQTADFLAALACDAVRELERRSLLLAHIRDLRALASEVALERLNLLELAIMLLAQLVDTSLQCRHCSLLFLLRHRTACLHVLLRLTTLLHHLLELLLCRRELHVLLLRDALRVFDRNALLILQFGELHILVGELALQRRRFLGHAIILRDELHVLGFDHALGKLERRSLFLLHRLDLRALRHQLALERRDFVPHTSMLLA